MNIKLTLILLVTISSFAQKDSLTTKQSNYKKFIIPSLLITSGIALNTHQIKDEFREDFTQRIFGSNFQWKVDDYLQYAPLGTLIVADLSTDWHKNSVWDQTKYLAIANFLNFCITRTLKHEVNDLRPGGFAHSFPSGHTSMAFTNATILYNEYKDNNMWIASSGYVFATTTAVLRMANNRHWVSDILAGAGIGMAVSQLVYTVEPLKKWQPFKNKNTALLPMYYDQNFGALFWCGF